MAKYNLLIAEDSPTMRFFIGFSLKRIPDVNIIETSDGVQALKVLTEQKVDLVIADINMPLMSGLTLLSKVREDSKLKDIPVILCTTEAEVREEGTRLGANAFLSKPVRQDELNTTVKSLLNIK